MRAVEVLERDFDIDSFLGRPLLAHLATSGEGGPSVTPVWFLWEDEAIWIIAGAASGFARRLLHDPRAAIGIVDFDLDRGVLRHLGLRGSATVEPVDVERRARLIRRYLGSEHQWNPSFRESVIDRQDVLLKFVPRTAVARDQSYFRYDDFKQKIPAAFEGPRFLGEWHARYAGATSAAFWYGRIANDGRSSYALLVADAARLAEPKTVIDLACGDGYLLALLSERMPSSQLIGIDLSPEELELALQREFPQNVRLLIGSAESLPLADASADAILCHMAFMLFENARGVVEELARVLRPGGTFAAILGPAPGRSELVARFGAFLHDAEEAENLPPLHVGDTTTYLPDSLRGLFASDAWNALRIDDVRLRFEGSNEQIQATLLGMYNVARLSEKGRDRLAIRLATELRERREKGASTECTLGLRHLVVTRTDAENRPPPD